MKKVCITYLALLFMLTSYVQETDTCTHNNQNVSNNRRAKNFMEELKKEFVQYSSETGKKILYTPTKPIKDISNPNIQKIIAELKTCVKGKGIGLAANQIGYPYQIFILEYEENACNRYPYLNFDPVALQVFINPKITKASNEKVYFWHGCLSAIGEKRGLVSTYRWIEYAAFDENGNRKIGRLDGIAAVIFQHEFRHLLGSLYLDHAHCFLDPEELIASFESGKLKPYGAADESIPFLLSGYTIGKPIFQD